MFRLLEGILFFFKFYFWEIWRMFVCILFYMYINFIKINEFFFLWLKIEYDYYWGKKWKVMEYLSGFFLYYFLYWELNFFWMGFVVLFFVFFVVVGYYICRYNGLVFVKLKLLKRKIWFCLCFLFFLSLIFWRKKIVKWILMLKEKM